MTDSLSSLQLPRRSVAVGGIAISVSAMGRIAILGGIERF